MKKHVIGYTILILAVTFALTACGYRNGPPDDSTSWPENHVGVFSSEYGTMEFNGDGTSVAFEFSKEFADAAGCPEEKQEGTYAFLFDKKFWRYDKADSFVISVADVSYNFSNVFSETNENEIALFVPDLNDGESIVFKKQ